MRKHEKAWKGEPGKQVLEVRVRAARLAWLDAPLTWHENRVYWGSLAPTDDDFRRAHAALFRLRSMPLSGANAFPDFPAWLARKEAQLVQAQALVALPTTPLETLTTDALVPLLEAEALCTNSLPLAPSALLVRRAAQAIAVLEAPEAPQTPLARLVRGACHRRCGSDPRTADPVVTAGLHFGLFPEPMVALGLQAHPEGNRLRERVQTALALLPPRWTTPARLRYHYAQAGTPECFVAGLEQLAQAYRASRGALQKTPEVRRYVDDPALSLATLCASLETIAALHAHAEALFPLPEGLVGTLVQVATLAEPKRAACLRFLAARVAVLWPLDEGRARSKPNRRVSWQRCCLQRQAPLVAAFQRLTDPALIATADRYGVLERAFQSEDHLRLWVEVHETIYPEPTRWLPYDLEQVFERLRSVGALRKALRPLLKTLQTLPHAERADWVEWLTDPLPSTRAGFSYLLPSLLRCVPALRRLHRRELISETLRALALLELSGAHHDPLHREALLGLVRTQSERVHADALRFAAELALPLSREEPTAFLALFTALATRPCPRYHWQLTDALPSLNTLPTARAVLRQALPHQTERCLELLRELGFGHQLPRGTLAALEQLAEQPAALASEWAPFLEHLPEQRETIGQLCQAQALRGLSLLPPPGLQKILALPARLTAEREYLRTRPELAVRLANVEARLADPAALVRSMTEELLERLSAHTAEARLAALEVLLARCYRDSLQAALGTTATPIPESQAWRSAALLTAHVKVNRTLLLRLLEERLLENPTWAETLPENRAYLEQLAARGVSVAAWLAENPETVSHATGSFRLWLARDPLTILQMGNPFDTCLSAWGFNAFSTIANALEANKRVLFVTDSAGRVIGRKLLALNEQGELVGYHDYCSLEPGPARQTLSDAMRAYCRGFAERCGLSLGEAGPVPLLLAEDWYDDGTVSWEPDPDTVSCT